MVLKSSENAAKFLMDNIIYYQEFKSKFLQFLTSLALPSQPEASRKFTPEVMKRCIATLSDYFTQENPPDPDRRTISLTEFVTNCYFSGLMSAEDFNECIEMILNSLGKSITQTKANCVNFMYGETLEKMAVDYPQFLLMRVNYVQTLVCKSYVKPVMIEHWIKKPVAFKTVEVNFQVSISSKLSHKTAF